MIVMPRTTPIYIKKLEALVRRLPQSHPKRVGISEQLSKRLAGFKGEQEIDFPLSFLPEEEYHLFHDLRLFDGTHYFQLDTLILSQRFILILEVKNIKGTLYFDSHFNQLIRTIDDIKEGFPDPILQVKRQSAQLAKWLRISNYPIIPIETFVVVSTPRTMLQTSSNNQYIYNKVLHSATLPYKVNEIHKSHQKEALQFKQLRNLSNEFINKHVPLEVDILLQQNISQSDIQTGVQCPNCFFLPLERDWGRWRCSQCSTISKDAHVQTFEDYALLINSTITNSSAREFLQVSSSTIVKKILSSMKLPHNDLKKGRKYYLS
ncbi:nuclease-related domain-containing protein [Cytobacillus sp. IB215316]|uniref:nuclease-related domain-containing protein n=1 Tax=Cytobacillus sp. IB215316 TaxID=3097354 RepID=UPI002A14AB64|nr:nuclease-related domain-containing protein [Cytobacillus sp. IB215316]MDX8360741.1 nuclease-related domain-containing protein [Cytobacillus sp. IB215316]